MDTTLFMLCLMASPVFIAIAIIIIKQDPTYGYENEETESVTLPTGQNVIAMRDAEALAYISKHPAMNTHRSHA